MIAVLTPEIEPMSANRIGGRGSAFSCDEDRFVALAPASMAGLCHKVRHNILIAIRCRYSCLPISAGPQAFSATPP